jgi:hypothetical protein
MKNKSGLHPYDAALFYILVEREGKLWPPRGVHTVSGWFGTRLVAHAFGKTPTDVARDIIDRALKLEEGEHGHERQRHDPDAA